MQLRINKILKSQQGFSLIEILVALLLVATIMALSISNPFGTTDDLESEVKNIERAITYMSDESAIRNTITRLHIYLSKDPQEYAIEYGPSSQFVLPAKSEDSINVMTKEEEEAKAKETKELNSKFARISDFQESNATLKESVKVFAVGDAKSKMLQENGEVSVYSFPSGEKDEVFIALYQDESIATITTSAFTSKIVHNYYHLDRKDENLMKEERLKKAKELFETWLKEKK